MPTVFPLGLEFVATSQRGRHVTIIAWCWMLGSTSAAGKLPISVVVLAFLYELIAPLSTLCCLRLGYPGCRRRIYHAVSQSKFRGFFLS